MNSKNEIFLAYRLVAAFSDGCRLLFDGITEDEARRSMEAAQQSHGDIVWYDGVTDTNYVSGRYYRTLPPPFEISVIDFSEN